MVGRAALGRNGPLNGSFFRFAHWLTTGQWSTSNSPKPRDAVAPTPLGTCPRRRPRQRATAQTLIPTCAAMKSRKMSGSLRTPAGSQILGHSPHESPPALCGEPRPADRIGKYTHRGSSGGPAASTGGVRSDSRYRLMRSRVGKPPRERGAPKLPPVDTNRERHWPTYALPLIASVASWRSRRCGQWCVGGCRPGRC
jgi:hypothetical protein